MEQEVVSTLALEGTIVHDFSILGLFIEADIVVKVVIVMLVLASFWTWAIIFDKLLRLRRLGSLADDFEEAFWSGGTLDDLYDRIDKRPADAEAAFKIAAPILDRMAGKGIIHKNKAARHKSRYNAKIKAMA